VAAGGYLPFVFSSYPVVNTAAPVVQTAGGRGCWSVLGPWALWPIEAHVYYLFYTLSRVLNTVNFPFYIVK
jgi:hypothetical protein